jgi:hypothetical protein
VVSGSYGWCMVELMGAHKIPCSNSTVLSSDSNNIKVMICKPFICLSFVTAFDYLATIEID